MTILIELNKSDNCQIAMAGLYVAAFSETEIWKKNYIQPEIEKLKNKFGNEKTKITC